LDEIVIDGSHGEGGGAILRLSAAMGIIFNRNIRVVKIRANRDTPGLREQHLMGLEALATLCGGNLTGGKVGSTEILFEPGDLRPCTVSVRIGTAGAIGLVYQILSIACAGFHGEQGDKIEIIVEGGATYGKWAPPVSYIKNILVPLLDRIGFSSDISVKRQGFYPKGGAAAKITFYPVNELAGIDLSDRGTIVSIEGDSVASANLRNTHVADRQATSLVDAMKAKFPGVKSHVIANYVDALNPGSGIVAWAKTSTGCVIGSDAIGEQRLPAEKVGRECARGLIKVLSSPATVDEYASDQLIPFLMLSKQHSRIIMPELTNHARTNIEIIKNYFFDRSVLIDEREDHVVVEFPAMD